MTETQPTFNYAMAEGPAANYRTRTLPSGTQVAHLEIETGHGLVPVLIEEAVLESFDFVPGSTVRAEGHMRRRYFKAGVATASRTELLATKIETICEPPAPPTPEQVEQLIAWVRDWCATGELDIRDSNLGPDHVHVALYGGWLDTREMTPYVRSLLLPLDPNDQPASDTYEYMCELMASEHDVTAPPAPTETP